MALVGLLWLLPARADRVKDLVRVQGVRNNQLMGYGLVVGLNQSGDDLTVPFTQQSILAMLRRMGTFSQLDLGRLLNTRDSAAVVVTALVPPFARSGSQIDVNVAALGNARSLQGGVLVATPLRTGDGRTYAVAQGPLLVGGVSVIGGTGSLNQRNHVTTGRIPEGAILERDMPSNVRSDVLTFVLKNPDFNTATRIAKAFEKELRIMTQPPKASAPEKEDKADKEEPADKEPAAEQPAAPTEAAEALVRTPDSGTVQVQVPAPLRAQVVEVAARLEGLEVDADVPARVVINERSGVIVVGQNVRLGRAAVSHGRLTLRVDEGFVPSQPGPFGRGSTVVVPQTRVDMDEANNQLRVVGPAAKVEDVVQTLNLLGLSTRDMIAVLQALKASGALRGELLIE